MPTEDENIQYLFSHRLYHVVSNHKENVRLFAQVLKPDMKVLLEQSKFTQVLRFKFVLPIPIFLYIGEQILYFIHHNICLTALVNVDFSDFLFFIPLALIENFSGNRWKIY